MQKGWKTIPKQIWILGLVSLCMDTSSELIHSLLPLLMVSSLGASMTQVGLLEGLAEALSLILKLFSGLLSDFLRKRKLLTLIGYTLSALTKPLFPLATSLKMVFTARLIDRIGKGIRGAPRDALVSELSPPEIRGACFGVRQTLDTIGACLGPLLAMAGIAYYNGVIQKTLWLAIPPAIFSVLLLAFFIQDPKVDTPEPDAGSSTSPPSPFHFSNLLHFNERYWKLLFIASLLTLARFSDAFLVLKAQSIGLPLLYIPAVMLIMNIIYTVTAYPAGLLSDRWSRNKLLFIGSLLLLTANLLLALSQNYSSVFFAVILWGSHMGLTQGVLAAIVADCTPIPLRGSAYGMFYFTCGIMTLISSVLAGVVWDHYGPFYTFCIGAFIAYCGCLSLLLFGLSSKKST